MSGHLHTLRAIVEHADGLRDRLKYRDGIDADILDEARDDRTLERLMMAARLLDIDDGVRPPGHTCPAIDRAQSALRRLAWRCANPNHYGVTPGEVLAEGLAALEQVRAENAQMRQAFARKVPT